MDKKFGIKHVVAMGIGTALFVVLTNVQIPVGFIPNTALQTRAAVLAFFSAIFGPVVGGAIGLIGHALGDAVFYGSVWWSWVFPDAVFGIIVGLFAAKYKVKEGSFGGKEIGLFNIVQVVANCTGMDSGCSGFGHRNLCRACKKGIHTGRDRFCCKCNYHRHSGNSAVSCLLQGRRKVRKPFQRGLIHDSDHRV